MNGGVGTKKITSHNEFINFKKNIRRKDPPDRIRVIVSAKATCCHLKGSIDVVGAIEREMTNQDLHDQLQLVTSGCLGFCQVEPVIIIQPGGIFYPDVTPEKVPQILKSASEGGIANEFLYTVLPSNTTISHEKDIPFYGKQNRIVLHFL